MKMQIFLAVFLSTLVSAASSQVLGTNRLLSETQFCKKYKCRLSFTNALDANTMGYYYALGNNVSFIAYRYKNAAENINSSLLQSASFRIKADIPNANQITLINDFLYIVSGIKLSREKILACTTANDKQILFSLDEGYTTGECFREFDKDGKYLDFQISRSGV